MHVDEPPKDGNIPVINISKTDICPFRASQRSFLLAEDYFCKSNPKTSR